VKHVAALAVLVVLGAAAPSTQLLREQAWTAASETLARDLTHAPGECLARTAPDIEIGRALFRSPNLLGGQAARAGLSCHACHSNGGINTRFMLPELTNRAGHSDVTSEWASATRGDGVMNPVPIPDLVGAAGHATFGQAREPSLETFVRGVIVDEFQGEPPSDQAFSGMIAYLRALRLSACPTTDIAITLASASEDVRRAITAAESADPETARAVLLAAQDMMGRIVERLPSQRFTRDRRRLEQLSRELGALRNADDVRAALATAAPGWRTRFDAAVARVARREERTYFNEATLREALAR
jgi:hypothetical protein